MNHKMKQGIRMRLIIGFAVAPLIMVILNIVGVYNVNLINKGLTTINDVNSVKQRYAINFRGSVHDRAISLRDVVLNSDSEEIQKSLKEIEVLTKFYAESAGPMDNIFKSGIVTDQERKLLQDIKDIEIHTLPLIEQAVAEKLKLNDANAWKILMEDAKPAFITWLARINKFIDYQEALNGVESTHVQSVASGFQQMMIFLTLASVLLSAVIGYLVTRSIIRPLRSVASEIDSSSKKIASVSEVISESSRTLAIGSKNQAQAIESISSSLEEMNAMIQMSADNSQSAARLASESRERARTGESVVKEMLQSMDDIRLSNNNILIEIDDSYKQISEIVSVIAEIGSKTQVINDIVFQTKLLSFNASVEAARAGESGRGFAVVAEEVGNLAQMSGSAAKEISDLLGVSRKKVESIVSETKRKVTVLMESGKAKVEVGTTVAKQCSEVLAQILAKVNDVTRMAEEISNASKEQSQGFREITKNVGNMEGVTQKNAIVANETAEILQSLNTQATELRKAFDDLSQLISSEEKASQMPDPIRLNHDSDSEYPSEKQGPRLAA